MKRWESPPDYVGACVRGGYYSHDTGDPQGGRRRERDSEPTGYTVYSLCSVAGLHRGLGKHSLGGWNLGFCEHRNYLTTYLTYCASVIPQDQKLGYCTRQCACIYLVVVVVGPVIGIFPYLDFQPRSDSFSRPGQSVSPQVWLDRLDRLFKA